jgi:hypothetical protein
LDWQGASDVIDDNDSFKSMVMGDLSDYIGKNDDGLWAVVGASSDDDNEELVPWLIESSCSPGQMTQFTASSSSTIDPIFSVVHNLFERFFHNFVFESNRRST